MTKLNQIIAVLTGKKTQSQKQLADLYKIIQGKTLFDGVDRAYRPLDEEGEQLPPEKKKVQVTVGDSIQNLRRIMTDVIDLTATQDLANCQARGDVYVNGGILLQAVPVTTLIYLEKRLEDLRSFIGTLPTLDPAETWSFNEAAGCFTSDVAKTNRTKKVPRAHVLYEATDKHPAQVETYTEDVIVGRWNTIKLSGAMEQSEKDAMLQRLQQLIEGVKKAREEANAIEVTDHEVAASVFDFVFNG